MARRVLVLAALVLLAACGDDDEKEHRGVKLLTDMRWAPTPRSQSALVSPDGGTQVPVMMPPVAGTVPRSGPGYVLGPDDLAEARRLVNPHLPTGPVLRSGQAAFLTFCAACHGRDGDPAKASLAPFIGGIPSLNGPNVAALGDGELFHYISAGKRRMPDFRAQLAPDERWALVLYLRALGAASILGEAEAAALLRREDGAAFVPPAPALPEYRQADWQVPGGRP